MDRIFQHYEGNVAELEGLKFTIVKSLVDDNDKDVYLLWFYDEVSDSWYRIFTDGIYCGIDKYSDDLFGSDEDDDISWEEHSNWFRGKTLTCATVSSDGKIDGDIILLMEFGESTFKLICKFEVGATHLEFS